jgi:dTDP-glucose pyrophosphorylase
MSAEGKDSVVGVVPAAGTGSRLGTTGRLKELLPVWRLGGRTGPACACLLSAFRVAGIQRAVFVLREGKEEVQESLGPEAYGVQLEYLIADRLEGPPYTVDRAFDLTAGSIVATGFPDVLFDAANPFSSLLDRLRAEPLDAVLGMFPVAPGQKADRVGLDARGLVEVIEPRGRTDDGRPAWAIAVWSPAFGRFLHDLLAAGVPADIGRPEPVMGDVLNAALEEGLVVGAKLVSDRPFLDIGTPAGLAEAQRALESGGAHG